MKEIRGGDLGIVNCDYVARGEDAKAVVKDLVAHLKEVHDINMPNPKIILDPDREQGLLYKIVKAFSGRRDRGAELIVHRLRTALDIETEGTSRSRP
jgi:predicted small metal-binding protein